MSKQVNASADPLRLYPARWQGPVILVCRKCEKKLKHSDEFQPLKVKKSLKRIARDDEDPSSFRVISVDCMKLCPKGGVTVCPPDQLTNANPGLLILRTQQDISSLYELYKNSSFVDAD